MLFANQPFKIENRKLPFGTLSGISIGERGQERYEIFLPTPTDLTGEIADIRTDLTIGTSKSGNPRINQADDDTLYMILSSEYGYTKRGCGIIRCPIKQENAVIARGRGADGINGRIGTWDAILVRAKDNDIFRISWGGHNYGFPETYYVVKNNVVYEAKQNELMQLLESLNIEAPFKFASEDGEADIKLNEWKVV